MKKLFKFLGLVGIVGASALLYQQYTEKQHQKMVSLALSNVRLQIDELENITGSWVDTTAQFDDSLNDYVFVGAVTTQNHQYDFVASAITGEILLVEKAI